MSTKDEAERLAKIWADGHYPHSRTYETEGTNGFNGFVAGFRAGEKSEKVQMLVEAADKLKFAVQMLIIQHNGSVPGLTPQQAFDGAVEARDHMTKALTLLNASPEEKK